MAERFTFRGFHSPNYTQVPDELFDELLPVLSGAELKVLLYIVRRTFGFKKPSDNISLSQITDGIVTSTGKRLDGGTGLVKSTAALAVKGLVEKNIIVKVRNQAPRHGDMATTYALNLITIPVQKSAPPVSENHTPPGQEIGHPVGRKSDTQETARQETVSKNVNVDERPPSIGRKTGSLPVISEQALVSRYGLTEEQIGEVRNLLDLQLDVLGAGDRNHAAYVQRAAEAARDGTANILRLAIGDVKDTNHRKTIVSLPAYFTRAYEAAQADALRLKAEPLLAPRLVEPATPTDDNPAHPQNFGHLFTRLENNPTNDPRCRLIADAERRGFPVPAYIRKADIHAVNRWWASLVTDSDKRT